MEVRLGDIGNIPDQHLYQLVYESLAGFQTVYHNIRPIKASGKNIGFNKRNELKIVLYEELVQEQQVEEISEEEVVGSVMEVYRGYLSNKVVIPPSMNFTEALYFVGYRISVDNNQQSPRKLHRRDPRFSMLETQSRIERESIEPIRQ